MRFFKIWCFLLLTLFLLSLNGATAWAVEDVSATDLQAAAGILVPSGDNLGSLVGYSSFHLIQKTSITGGISMLYEAYFSDDPWLTEELPHLQLLVFSYNSQAAAQQELAGLKSGLGSGKTVLDQDSLGVFYEKKKKKSVDSFATIDAEYKSYHLLHTNGNLLFQASLYRPNGTLNEANLKAYAKAIENTDALETILLDSVESTKLVLAALFPPTSADYTLNSESFSFALDEVYALPSHGTVSMDVYISEPSGAVGTLLDSTGLGTPEAGDLYLYVNTDGRLFAGIYAPDFDADCSQENGWYLAQSTEALSSYEWNAVALHFGVGGFGIDLNGEEVGTCSVSQSRSANALYLGDFPDDSLAESMLGYVDNVKVEGSTTDSGRAWDEVLTSQLFLDLLNTDPDLPAFEFLKEAHLFLGSVVLLYLDEILNRAEMVKILLKAFGKDSLVKSGVPFSDIPSDAWYRRYLNSAYAIGMIKGHEDGTFLPGHDINRAEFFTMLARVNGARKTEYGGEFMDVENSDWFASGAAYARSLGLVSNLFFYPANDLTRREAAETLYQLLK